MAAVAVGEDVGGVHQHHAQQAICASRAKYREGRRPRAVKVYTVNLESRYLLIQGVPALGVMKELVEQFALYGPIEEYNPLDDYPAEEFTEVYLIKFQKIQSARIAKRKLDERSFFGSLLHVCYAPEFESIQETREKLQDRRRYIAKATSKKEPLLTKKQDSNTSSQLNTSGSCNSGAPISYWNQPVCVRDRFESPCYELRSIPPLSEEHFHNILTAPQCVSDCTEMSEFFSQRAVTQNLHQDIPNSGATCHLQRKLSCDNGLGRFMPRTTQLQERKRRRDEDNKLALFGSATNSEETIIGPRLPETAKIDMDDDSLNTSASLIRNKLKEVAVPVQIPDIYGERSMNCQINPTAKQRRRI
nr:RNA-binding protein 48 isoform X1 [Pogona vitticeps]